MPITVAMSPKTIRTTKFGPILTYDKDDVCDLTFSNRFSVATLGRFRRVLYPNLNKSEHM